MTDTRSKLVIAATAGAVLALAAPPFDAYPTLWLGMGALAFCLAEDPLWPAFASRSRVALTGARRGLLFGAAANVVALRFIPGVIARFTPLPWAAGLVALVLLAFFEGTRWMVAGVACETLARARVPRPVAFAAGVYAGTFVPTMIPWTVAGGVSPWPAMVQLADVVGERGVTSLMALTAGLAASGVRTSASPRRGGVLWRWFAAAALLILAQAGVGMVRIAQRRGDPCIGADTSRVALVQPGIGATHALGGRTRAPAILAKALGAHRRAEAQGADLVVWPEAAYPYRLPHGSRREPADALTILQRGHPRPRPHGAPD